MQDALPNYSTQLFDLIVKECGLVYVCGDYKNMGKSVYNAFVNILNSGEIHGEEYMSEMVKDKRYKQDLWG